MRIDIPLYGDNFVVDERILTAQVVDQFLGIAGHGQLTSIRVLHVFALGAAIAQLTASAVTHDEP